LKSCNSACHKFLLFYGTRRFITVFTQARHRTLSWASWIHRLPNLFAIIVIWYLK